MTRRIPIVSRRERAQPWRMAAAAGLSALLLLGQTAPLLGNPTGGAVVAGSATIGPASATLTINQSTQNAIINWQQFSIANGETTKFVVPNFGATLNRVVGGNPSAIYGSLQSNGTLYLVNPSGIVVGPSGRIDTAGFLASTLDVSNEQFMAGGNLNFSGSSDAAISNAGTIHASGGDVYLIANQVNNSGTITAPQGTVGLAAGSDVLFQPAGNQHLFVQATAAGTQRAMAATNAGTIRAAAAELKAAGGNPYALAINNTGVIAASGYQKINGQVYLTATGGNVANRGTISAHTSTGDGGVISLVANTGTTTNSGTLDASAPAAGGAGGTIETSGASLQIDGTISTGQGGHWRLDPTDVTIDNGSGVAPDVNVGTLEADLNGGGNLSIQSSGNIDLNAPLTWTSTASLQLDAGADINLNQAVSATSGTLSLLAGGSITDTASLSVGSFILETGSWSQISATLPAFTVGTDFELQGGTFLRATGGNGSSGTPYQISDVYGLQGIGSPSGNLLNSSFQLTGTVDATGTAAWNNNTGFVPIGSDPVSGNGPAFTGSFDGASHAIDNLVINTPNSSYVGLFGEIGAGGSVQNLSLGAVQVSGDTIVGGLAGENDGTLTQVSSAGGVNGNQNVGGLVGQNNGTITHGTGLGIVSATSPIVGGLVGTNTSMISTSSSAAAVSGTSDVSGLVGSNSGTITGSSSSGTITGNQEVGGLAGDNSGTLGTDFSSSLVTGNSGSQEVGGLAGSNEGAITLSYSLGDVSGTDEVGGLVGNNASGGTISQSYSAGGVSGTNFLGGLVGYNLGAINNAFSAGAVTGATNASDEGGVAGFNSGTIGTTYSSGMISSGSGSTEVGGVVGFNSGTISGSFYDTTSTAAALGVGSDPTNTTPGVTPATNAQLESQTFINTTYPGAWDFTNTWTSLAGTDTPQLLGLPSVGLPGGLDTLSGTAFIDGGVTPAGAGLTIDLIFDGTVLGTNPTASGGAFTFNVSPADLTSGILLTDVTDNGTTYYQATSPASAITGVDIWGSTLRVVANTASNAALATAAGSASGLNYSVIGSTLSTTMGVNFNVVSAYTLDGNISAGGTITTGVSSALTGSQNVTLTASAMNLGGTIATTGTLTVNATGAIIDSAPVSAGGFVLENGVWTEIVGQNSLLTLPAFTDTGDFELQNSSTFERFAGGDGSTENPYQITDLYGLQGLASPSGSLLTSNAELINNIDATATSGWNAGAGFVPIGNTSTGYSATFDGQNFTIDHLTINLPSVTDVGLFGSYTTGSGTLLENVGLTNVSITGSSNVGALVGNDFASNFSSVFNMVSNDYSTGSVTGGSSVGGLVGVDFNGSITHSHSSATVSGTGQDGGLVGNVGGPLGPALSYDYSTGAVMAANNSTQIGGLVGHFGGGTINVAYSSGTVTAGSGSQEVGGLAGDNLGAISNAFSTGAVSSGSGSAGVGGLVGANVDGEFQAASSVTNSYSTGMVTAGSGSTSVGGFAGYNDAADGSTISNSFWDTQTAGSGVISGVGSDAMPNTTPGLIATTTAQLESQTYIAANAPAMPSFDFTNTWTTLNGTNTPQLIGLPATTPPTGAGVLDSLSGTAFTDSGLTLSPGVLIDLIFNGNLYNTATTNSSGGFSFNINSTILNGGILLSDAHDNGSTYYQANTPSSLITGVDIWGDTLRIVANVASNAALAAAAGNVSGLNYSVIGSTLSTTTGVNFNVVSAYTLDGNISASGTITTGPGATLTGGPSVTLAASAMNLGGSIATTGTLTLDAAGTILDSASVSVGGFLLQDGFWSEIVGQNGLAALPAFSDTGDFELQNSSTFERFAGGDGSTGNPYQITDVYGLQGLASPGNALLSASAELDNNIDATNTVNWNDGAGFVPIGNASTYYSGVFNGRNNTINGLTINRPGTDEVGLFGVASNKLENLALTNVNITGDSVVGGLAGSLGNPASGTPSTGIVEAVFESGSVSGQSSYVGGLLGLAHGTVIDQASSAGTVSGGGFVGGLIGSSLSAISNADSTASVSGGGPVGGLLGENYFGGTVSNTYSTGLVSGSSETGGLVGRNLNIIDNSFWDTTTSGIPSPTGGVGNGSNTGVTPATTAQLETQSFILANAPTLPTWDFSNIWTTAGDTSTPQLIAAGAPAQSVPPPPVASPGTGSNSVPPTIVTQNNQVAPLQPSNGSANNAQNSANASNPPPVSFAGTGTATQTGETGGGQLANASDYYDQVGPSDVVQLNNGQLDNAKNPEAASQLDQALGPAVRSALANALEASGDTVADAGSDNPQDAGQGETILEGGDVVEMEHDNVKSIPLSQAPKALQDALRNGLPTGAGR